jgi:hypothetical protein
MRWFGRKRASESPTVREVEIGEVRVDSGRLLFADPLYFSEPVTLEGLTPARYPVQAQVLRYPEGGQRVARIGIRLRPGAAPERRKLGTIAVDSAVIVAVDELALDEHWKEVGPERVGYTYTPAHHRRVAELIRTRFGLGSKELGPLRSVLVEPISEDLEARITAYLRTLPEYADYPFMYFRVETKNSFERVMEAAKDHPWGEVVLDEISGARLLAISSGFGDGSYPAEGLFGAGELRGIEIEFIGPAHEKALEALPVLE